MDHDGHGSEPDYRFSLANERTFLAWMRTSLALLAGGLVLHQFATGLQPWIASCLSLTLSFVAGVFALGGLLQWRSNLIAMRYGRPLPRAFIVPALAIVVIALSLVTLTLLMP